MDAKIISIERVGGSWKAVLEITYKDRVYRVEADKLLRKPASLEASLGGEYLVIKLKGEDGKGFASCYIHVSHLEQGCVECRCLLKPAG